jgi:hypothetical protein
MIIYCKYTTDDLKFLNFKLYKKEKQEAILIYSKLLNEKNDYSQIKQYVNRLVSNYGYFIETFRSILFFFKYISINPVNDILFVIQIYSDWMSYFSRGPYRDYVLKKIFMYLNKLKIEDGNIDFISFCDDVIIDLRKTNLSSKDEFIRVLTFKKNKNILKLADDCLVSGQIVYFLNCCTKLMYSINTKSDLYKECLKRLIFIYKKLNIKELVEKYSNILKNI